MNAFVGLMLCLLCTKKCLTLPLKDSRLLNAFDSNEISFSLILCINWIVLRLLNQWIIPKWLYEAWNDYFTKPVHNSVDASSWMLVTTMNDDNDAFDAMVIRNVFNDNAWIYGAKCVNTECVWLNISHQISVHACILFVLSLMNILCKWSKNSIDNYYVFIFKIHILMMIMKREKKIDVNDIVWKNVVCDMMTACQYKCAPNCRHLIIFPILSLTVNFSSRFFYHFVSILVNSA